MTISDDRRRAHQKRDAIRSRIFVFQRALAPEASEEDERSKQGSSSSSSSSSDQPSIDRIDLGFANEKKEREKSTLSVSAACALRVAHHRVHLLNRQGHHNFQSLSKENETTLLLSFFSL